MYRYKRMARTIVFYATALLLAVSYPLTAFADSVPSTTDTSTTTTSPAPTPNTDYSYNNATGHWDTSKWWYNPITKSYQPVKPKPVVASPAVTPDPVASATPTTSTPTTNTTAAAAATDNTSAAITNGVDSQAQTGNAAVTSNTTAGSATTGNAAATATVANIVNSTVNTGGSGPATFVENITGDVYGDIMLYPAMLAAMLQQSSAAPAPTAATVTTTNGVVNNVNLNATSGAATVSNNTSAGNATSGTANAVASVMNIINSIVAANQSFIGTINIYGNLNGDILVAPDFIPQLLASNAAANPAETDVSSTTTTGITNNVNLAAASGAANVTNNTSAGNATTGTTGTNLVVLNLTGHQVVASSSILVFVNVLGTWVGMIVDAPAGATAAGLGSGVTSSAVLPQTLTTNTTTQITNNINLAAQSGDATVSGNTNAGNATSGSATSSAMILNIANSTLGLSNWFGILNINVFGKWLGSFGIDTAAGNAPVVMETGSPASPAVQQAIAFVAHTRPSVRVLTPSPTNAAVDTEPVTPVDQPAVLGSAIHKDVKKTTDNSTPSNSFPLVVAILTGLGLAGIAWWIIAAARR